MFSPDGTLVATGSRDHTARAWDARTGDPLTLPLRTGDEVTTVAFDPTGNSLLMTSKDHTVQVRDLPPRTDPPAWLADLAEYASTQIRYDVSRVPRTEIIKPLRERLLAAETQDPWEKFGRWYFLENDVRPISPWSTVTLQAYVQGLAAAGDKDSLDYAISLSQNIPAWMVKLMAQREKLGEHPGATPVPKDDD